MILGLLHGLMTRILRAIRRWFRRKPKTVPPPVVVPPVVPPAPVETVLAFADFADGTARPFTAWGLGTTMDIIDDPTGLKGGKVLRILHTSPGGFHSSDQSIEWNSPTPFRYGVHIVTGGDVYMPSACVSGSLDRNREMKLIDWFGSPPDCRFILARDDGRLHYFIAQTEIDGLYAGQWHLDVRQGDTGIVIDDDRWYNIKAALTTNTADGVADGKLEISIDGVSRFVLATGLSPITEKAGGTSFRSIRVGSTQVTTQAGDPAMSQYRYWKNISIRVSA